MEVAAIRGLQGYAGCDQTVAECPLWSLPAQDSISSGRITFGIVCTIKRYHLPISTNLSHSLPPKEYLVALLQPVADLCNQLHTPRVLKTPMSSVSVDLGDCKS